MGYNGSGPGGTIPEGTADGKTEFSDGGPVGPYGTYDGGTGPGSDVTPNQPAVDGKTQHDVSNRRPGQGELHPSPQGSPDLSSLPQPGYHVSPPGGVDAQRGVDLIHPVGEGY